MQAVSYGARSRQYSPLLPAYSSQPRSIVERPRSGPMRRVHIYTTIQAFFKTAQACLKNGFGRFALSALPHKKHALSSLARSTPNELQQNQHEKASLVCACTEPVRTGIGAVCVEYGRPKWPITMLNIFIHTGKYFLFYFWCPMLVRPDEDAFLPEGSLIKIKSTCYF